METKPPRPEDTKCKCGATLEPVYVEPVFYSIGKSGPQKKFSGTGIWDIDEMCPSCVDQAQKEREENRKKEEMERLFMTSGFMPKEFEMASRPWEGNAKLKDAIYSWWKGEGKSLYLHGTPGNGKTHAASAALREFIRNTRLPGKFWVVSDLVRRLRMAVKTHEDDRLIGEIASAPALVLDDIAVERPTGFVLEAMQSIIDIRYRNLDRLTIITSNLSIDQLAERLDDRIASRLISMCEIIEFNGNDRRLLK